MRHVSTSTSALALIAWLSLAATAYGSPIAQESRAEIGGSATLSAEHQARQLADPGRQAATSRAESSAPSDADELFETEAGDDRLPAKQAELAPGFFLAPEGAAAPALAQTPAPLSTFTANRSDGSLAADTSIAVSFTHVVVTNRNQIGYYSKAGRSLGLIRVDSLFARLGLATLFGTPPAYFDTHALYDAYRHRFWIGALAQKRVGSVTKSVKFVVAVSRTSNPLDGWNLYWWDALPGDGQPGVLGYQDGDEADYPVWGLDSFGVYQSNYFCHPGNPRDCAHQQVTFFPAAPLAAGAAAPLGWLYYDLKNPDGSPASGIIQPALHHGTSGGSTYFVSSQNPNVIVWRLRNHLTSTQVLENVAVPVAGFDLPTVDRAAQKNSSATIWLTNPGNEVLKAVYRAGNLYAVFNDAAPWFTPSVLDASIRLVRLNVSQFPAVTPTVDRYFGGNSAFYDQPNARISYAFPSVEVNKSGDAVVVYGRAGSSLYPEVFYSVYPAGGPDILPSRRLRQGDAPVQSSAIDGVVQLHDFDGASVDPFDDTAVWMAAPYGEALSFRSTENWAIAVGKVFGKLVADLIVESVSHAVGTSAITVTAKVRDQGDRAAEASTVTFSLRPLSGGAAVKLGSIACKSLTRDELVTLTGTFARPAGLAKGSYVLTATADATNAVLEYSGANNSNRAARAVVLK